MQRLKRELHKLLIKVLETKKVYVDMSTIEPEPLSQLKSFPSLYL